MRESPVIDRPEPLISTLALGGLDGVPAEDNRDAVDAGDGEGLRELIRGRGRDVRDIVGVDVGSSQVGLPKGERREEKKTSFIGA